VKDKAPLAKAERGFSVSDNRQQLRLMAGPRRSSYRVMAASSGYEYACRESAKEHQADPWCDAHEACLLGAGGLARWQWRRIRKNRRDH
jgi:hypothetical protein